ncbi:MAG: hypothetical protein AAF587_39265 [Bacteroidota bacterium]
MNHIHKHLPTSMNNWVVMIFLSIAPVLGLSQPTSPLSLDAHTVQFSKTKVDSLSGQSGNHYRCQIKLELPNPKRVAAIHLKIKRTGNNHLIRSVRIPVDQGNRRRKGVGFIRRGKHVYLNVGKIVGNPKYQAIIHLEDRKGRLSAPVSVQ